LIPLLDLDLFFIMPSSKKPIKIKPSEVASDTKKRLIPEVSKRHHDRFPPYSYLYAQPLIDVLLEKRETWESDLPSFSKSTARLKALDTC
jgi:hypothetical protein